MTQAVIVSTARTPLAKSWKGAFNMTHGATLGGFAVAAAVQRAGIEPHEVDDVIMGCATPEGATGSNIARQIALRAGLPVTTSGLTVNRFCSSGLQAIAMAPPKGVPPGTVFLMGRLAEHYAGVAARARSCSSPGSSCHGVPGCRQPAVHFSALITRSAKDAPFGLVTTAFRAASYSNAPGAILMHSSQVLHSGVSIQQGS